MKSAEAQLIRTTLQARRQIVVMLLQIQGSIGGLLRMHGLKIGEVHRNRFDKRVRELLKEVPLLSVAIAPLLRVLEQLVAERKVMDNRLGQAARRDATCLRLMTIPGVGPITSLAFRVTVDDPARFASSKAVGAHLGLTPRIYQSGETDRSGEISNARKLAVIMHRMWVSGSRLQTGSERTKLIAA